MKIKVLIMLLLFSTFYWGVAQETLQHVDPKVDATVNSITKKLQMELPRAATLRSKIKTKFDQNTIEIYDLSYEDATVEGVYINVMRDEYGEILNINSNIRDRKYNLFPEEKIALNKEEALDKLRSIYPDQSISVLNDELVILHSRWSYKIDFKVVDRKYGGRYYIDAIDGSILDKEIEGNLHQKRKTRRNDVNNSFRTGADCDAYTVNLPDPNSSSTVDIDLDDYTIDGVPCLGDFDEQGDDYKPVSLAYYIDHEGWESSDFDDYTCDGLSDNYPLAFTYYHLNGALQDWYTSFGIEGGDQVGLRFDANAATSGPLYNQTLRLYELPNYESPYGSELFWVANGAIEHIIYQYIGDIVEGAGDELIRGLRYFYAQSYEWSITDQNDPVLYDYAGIELGKKFSDAANCKDETKDHGRDTRFTSFLMKLRDDALLGRSVTEDLVFKTLMMFPDLTDEEVFLANMYYMASKGGMSCDKLVELADEMEDFYGVCYMDEDNGIEFSLYYPGSSVEYYIRDSGNDEGDEPFSNQDNNIWESPDIWNSYVAKKKGHKDPKTLMDNYINVEVRNKVGAGTIGNARLKIYYSDNLTDQGWPTDWIELTSCGGIPITEAGIYYIDWNPPAPEPGKEKKHVCIYARIVEDPVTEHGRVIGAEGITEIEGGEYSTGNNTKNFKGIAWKNMDVERGDGYTGPGIQQMGYFYIKSDTLLTDTTTVGIDTVAGPINVICTINPVPNPDGTLNPINPRLPIQDERFFEKVDIFVRVDPDLAGILGVTNARSWIPITSDDFGWNNILLEKGKRYGIEVGYIPKRLKEGVSFAFKQSSVFGKESIVTGGMTYVIASTFSKGKLVPRAEDFDSGNFINVYPNPLYSDNLIKLVSEKNMIAISLLNNSGQVFKKINGINTNMIEVDLGELKGGIYYILAEYEDGTSLSKKITKQ